MCGMKRLDVRCVLPVLLAFSACASGGVGLGDALEATEVLDALHERAAEPDGEEYFALFTPDAIFYGTDATERWTVEEFRAYAEPLFSQGQGWSMSATERSMGWNGRQDVAWFDERLEHEKYGELRGSGVLVLTPEGWRVEQYVLSFPVPNELAEELVQMVRELDG